MFYLQEKKRKIINHQIIVFVFQSVLLNSFLLFPAAAVQIDNILSTTRIDNIQKSNILYV